MNQGKIFSRSLWAGLFLLLCTAAVQSAPIPKLFNTGVDDQGALLPINAVDPHYRLVVSPDPNFPGPETRTLNPGFPVGPWIAEGPNSKWIAPRAAQGTGNAPGDYTYRTTFDLTGFDPAKATITGKWSSDNAGLDIVLNGVALGIPNSAQFGAFTDFTIASGFVAGTNTLDFILNNAEPGINPTGLRVEMLGVVELPSEPPSIVNQPVGGAILIGEEFTLSVLAQGTPPLSYQWRLNGTNIAGASEPSLVIAAAALTNSGAYSVMVTNNFGTKISSNAVVQVLEPIPGLYNSGVNNDRVVLDDFTVDPHYSIIVNPDSASPEAFVHDSTVFPIVTGPWLANSDVSKWIGPRGETSGAASGEYTYRLTFNLGQLDPANAFITGRWSTDNPGLDILLNGASLGIQNGAQFGGYTTFRITTGFLSGTNHLDFKLRNDGAGYTGLRVDQLRGGAGRKTGPAVEAPRIVAQPQGKTAFVGETVTFSVLADGTAPLSYQWKFNNQNVASMTNSSLVISNASAAHAGEYLVTISNSAGQTNSAAARLIVLEPIPGLFNTGVGNDRLGLADGEIDPHYKLIANAQDPLSSNAIVENSTVWPIVAGPWVPNKETAKWIGPQMDPNGSAGDYTYRLSFVLDGFDPASVILQGGWATDNAGSDIVVNGTSTGIRNDAQFASLTSFTITNGFKAGTNTLDFIVNNAGDGTNPTGFFVDNLRAGGRRSGVGQPRLAIQLTRPDVTITWPASNLRLFATPSLTNPTWTLVPEQPALAAGTNTLKLPISGNSRFFRLQQ